MAFFIRKTHHLILDARAVSGADALDHPPVQGRAVQVVQNDSMGLRVGVGDVAVHLIFDPALRGQKAEGLRRLLAGLGLQHREINAPPVHPGGGTGFEPAQGQPRLTQPLTQQVGRLLAVRTALHAGVPHKNASAQIGAGAEHHRLGPIKAVQAGIYAGDPAILQGQIHDLALLNVQVIGLF